MSVYFSPQRQRWFYDFTYLKKRYNAYCIDPETGDEATNKTTAQRIETKIKARIMAAANSAPLVNPRTVTFGQIATAYASQIEGTKRWTNRKTHVRELVQWFGPITPVQTISEARVNEYISWSRKQKCHVWAGGPKKATRETRESKEVWREEEGKVRGDSTINRYLDCLRLILAVAHQYKDPMTGQPIIQYIPKVPKLREIERTPNPVPAAAIGQLTAIGPDYLTDAIKLAALTGMRKQEIFSRKIGDYRAELRSLRISGEDTKGKRDEMIPLNALAVQIIEKRIKLAREEKIDHLFFYKGANGKLNARPIKDPRRSWDRARAQLEGQGFRFHDLKASFVTAVALVNPAAAQQLARHKDASTTKRYIKVADSFLRDTIETMGGLVLSPEDQKSRTKVPNKKR